MSWLKKVIDILAATQNKAEPQPTAQQEVAHNAQPPTANSSTPCTAAATITDAA